MMTRTLLLACLAAAGCSDTPRDVSALRDAVDHAKVSIHDMVTVAEGSMADGRAITAELRVDATPVYAYGTVGAGMLHDVRVDTIEGAIVSSTEHGAATGACPGSITLAEAIAIAEADVPGGTVIAAIPDDDVSCAREIQVLESTTLWEVKVGGDGAVLEHELSDENED